MKKVPTTSVSRKRAVVAKASRNGEGQGRVRRIATLSDGFFLASVAAPHRSKATKSSESAAVLVKKAARALSKSGIRRDVIFPRHGTVPFVYSADPNNPSRIIRETAKGKRTVGRFVHGRFRAR